MRVYIGPYKNWIGPYQIADWLQKVGVSEDRCYKIGEKLNKTFLKEVCEYIHRKKKTKVDVRIDNYDIWSMDHTLSLIIYPMLKKMKELKNGCPLVDDDDVPDGLGLKSTEAPPKKNEWDWDDNCFKRWDWVLDEMIWAFEQIYNEFDNKSEYFKMSEEEREAFEDRLEDGLYFFGKYYRSLWD